MGTFIGHVYPGLFLVLYGLYQATVVSRALIFNDCLLYSSCLPNNKGRWSRLWKIAHGGWLKIVTGSLLIVYEISCIKGGLKLMDKGMPPRFMYPKEWQHLTMFTLLTLDGCVDVLSKNVLPQRCVALERGAMVLGFYELLLLLVSHVKDSSGVELHVHSLLILVVFLLMLVLTAELWTPEMFHLWIMETFLFLMMGSWLMQAGFILFRPVSGYPWDDDDISDVMFVTTFFCWHMIINALCLLGIYGLSSFWHHCYSPSWKLMGSKEAPYHESTSGPVYRLLREVEELDKDDQAPSFQRVLPVTGPRKFGTLTPHHLLPVSLSRLFYCTLCFYMKVMALEDRIGPHLLVDSLSLSLQLLQSRKDPQKGSLWNLGRGKKENQENRFVGKQMGGGENTMEGF